MCIIGQHDGLLPCAPSTKAKTASVCSVVEGHTLLIIHLPIMPCFRFGPFRGSGLRAILRRPYRAIHTAAPASRTRVDEGYFHRFVSPPAPPYATAIAYQACSCALAMSSCQQQSKVAFDGLALVLPLTRRAFRICPCLTNHEFSSL